MSNLGPKAVAAGIDIGGGSTKFGLLNSAGAIINRAIVKTSSNMSKEDIVDTYVDCLNKLITSAGPVTLIGVGIGFPGHINVGRQSGDFSNIPALDNLALCELLSKQFHCVVKMENDATVAALAESSVGTARSHERFMLVTLGTGIGVGFIVNGVPQETAHGCMGVAGHVIVDFQRRAICRQGCHGCLESVASAEALDVLAQQLANRNPKGYLGKTLTSVGVVGTADIFSGASSGDTECRDAIYSTARWIGMAVSTWCHIFAPTLIRFGGGLSAAGPGFVEQIRYEAQQFGLQSYLNNLHFEPAMLRNDAGIVGAAHLVQFQS